jgi:hypothetical protein
MSASVQPVPLPAPPLRQRRWVPVLVVAVLLVGIVSGGYVTADALGGVGGETVVVSPSVTVTALPGWELAERFEGPTGIRLTKGGASLDVASLPFTGSSEGLVAAYVENILEPGAEQFRVSETVEGVVLESGQVGARITYVGLFGDVQAPIEGEVTAVVTPDGLGVIFDGWAPSGQLQFAIDDIHTMIRRAEIT